MFAFSSCHFLFTSFFNFFGLLPLQPGNLTASAVFGGSVLAFPHVLTSSPGIFRVCVVRTGSLSFLPCFTLLFCFGGGSLGLKKKRAGGLRDFSSPRLPPALVKTQTPSGFSFLCGVTPLFQLCFLFVLNNRFTYMSNIRS